MAERIETEPLSSKPASDSVVHAHAALQASLPFDDTQDFADARRGFIATIPDATVLHQSGRPIWSMQPYAFQQQEAAPHLHHMELSSADPDCLQNPYRALCLVRSFRVAVAKQSAEHAAVGCAVMLRRSDRFSRGSSRRRFYK